MIAYAFDLPILSGKLQAFKRLMAEASGPQKKEHHESRRHLGITREMVWLQQMPFGDMAIVYWESDHPMHAFKALGSSNLPYDRWFVQQIKDISGIDLTKPLPERPNELVYTWQES